MREREHAGDKVRDGIFDVSAAREVDEELQFHLAMRVRELVAQGMTPDEAERVARGRFADMTRIASECRELAERREQRVKRTRYVTNLVQDMHFALRMLRRRPAFALLATLTIALGIGAATAIYSVVDGVMLRPLPFADAGRLVAIWVTDEGFRKDATLNSMWDRIVLGHEEFDAIREHTTTVRDAALWATSASLTTDEGGRPERLATVLATSNMLRTLAVQPALGRGFLPGEDALNGPPVAMVSWEAWQNRWHGDSALVGRSLLLDGQQFTVVGVLPRGLRIDRTALAAPVWIPAFRDSSDLPERHNRSYRALARLKPGITVAAANADVSRAFKSRAQARGDTATANAVNARVEQWQMDETRTVRASLWIVFGAVVLLMLIACVNVATLMLGEAARREAEMSARIALGASPSRIARQLLTEGLAISTLGALAGVALAYAGVRALVALAPPKLPGIDDVHVDARVLLFAAVAALATGLLFGLAPAVVTARDSGRLSTRVGIGQTPRGARRLQHGLIATEVMLSMVLLVGCTLLGRSLLRLTSTPPGFNPANITVVRLAQDMNFWRDDARMQAFSENATRALQSVPGVTDVVAASSAPFAQGNSSSPVRSDVREYDGRRGENAQQRYVQPNYFRALEIPVLAGRSIDASDGKGAELVIMVSEAEARRDWPNTSPLGHKLFWQGKWRTVIGIVGDIKYAQLSRDNEPMVYVPLAQQPSVNVLLVKSTLPAANLDRAIRARLRDIDPSVAVDKVDVLPTLIGRSYADERYRALLSSLFGILAAVLAMVGIFGVASRAVARRARENGIRVALGATARALTMLLVRETLVGVLVGLVVGLPIAMFTARLLSPYLFGIRAGDPVTFAAAVLVLSTTALAAVLWPARRAGRADPATVLRSE